MKKEDKWLLAAAGAVGVATVAYKLLSKDIPKGAVPMYPFDITRYLGK